MILNLKLQYFKCHKELEIEFGHGLQVIRGVVEAGKSSMLQGILYAWYGARALPRSLADTVTWGEAESKLRVEMVFQHAGVIYKVYRAKSGAEITADGLRVSGQSEVTKFVEKLFGAPAELAAKLMMIRQKDLAEVLNEKAGGATKLIQQLSDFTVLDNIVEKIQTQLPSGNTRVLEGLIEQNEKAEKPGELDLKPFDDVMERKAVELSALFAEERQLLFCQREIDVNKANLQYGALGSGRQRVATLKVQLATLTNRLDNAKAVKILPSQLEKLRKGQAQQALERRASVAHSLFLGMAKDVGMWDGTLTALEEFVKVNAAKETQHLRAIQAMEVEMGKLRGTKITETACGLCGKDLTNVPEVVAKNAQIDAELAALEKARNATETLYREAKLSASGGREVLLANTRWTDKLLTPYAEFLALEAEAPVAVPAVYRWTGPKMAGRALDMQNYDQLMAAETARLKAQEAAQAVLTSAEADLKAVQQQYDAALLEVQGLEELDPLATLAEYNRLQGLLQANLKTQAVCQRLVDTAKASKEAAAQIHANNLEQYAQSQARLLEMREQLRLTCLHNHVVTRVRDAKPEISKRLWHNVQHAISHYFSQIRGVPSVVTRDTDGFLVDGKPVEGVLSGSTEDSLALAVRIALLKTFLPNVDFMITDEPASAMNDEREMAMLGVLSTSEYQILLVTHSDLAESFAANLIEI